MFFRFGCALALVVAISLVGVALEKQNLRLRLEVSRQHYRIDVLREHHAGLRLRAHQLGAPERMIESLEACSLRHDAQARVAAAESGGAGPPLFPDGDSGDLP